jgi:hypothetical protein
MGARKGSFRRVGPPLIAAQGDLAAATMGAAKQWWPQSEGRRCSWAPLFGQGHQPMGTARFHYFLNYPKLVETCTIKMDALSCPKNSQCFHEARSEYFEQLSQLFWLQIPNRDKVKNPGIDSIFESLMNFRRDSNLLENLINSPKFLLNLIFTKMNLVGYTCM